MASSTPLPAANKPPPPTIRSLKLNFLTSQTTVLSQPLGPSRTWINGNNRAAREDSDAAHISRAAVDEALADLNQIVQRHCRRVYPPQASRNVAEQLDSLYEGEAERRLVGGMGDVEGGIGREIDLSMLFRLFLPLLSVSSAHPSPAQLS
jgi:hypothetical protein